MPCLSKVSFEIFYMYVIYMYMYMVLPSGLTQLYTTGPPEAAQEETQSLEAALSDEEVGLIYNVMPSLSDGLFQFCLFQVLSQLSSMVCIEVIPRKTKEKYF